MRLSTEFLLEHLRHHDVNTLVHANTAVTSTHFVRNQALLSRQAVDDLDLCQTAQASDEIDPVVGVWNDVFVDSVDIHNRGRFRNEYGPVLLEFDVAILEQACNGHVWVTKSNPWYWRGVPDERRWFQSTEELVAGFDVNAFCEMFVFRDCNGQLDFGDYLRQITIDAPDLQIDGTNVFDISRQLIVDAMNDADANVPIVPRNCRDGCRCGLSYQQLPLPLIQSLFMTCP